MQENYVHQPMRNYVALFAEINFRIFSMFSRNCFFTVIFTSRDVIITKERHFLCISDHISNLKTFK